MPEGEHPTPFERVIARRPAPDDLQERDFDQWLDVTWKERDDVSAASADDGAIAVGPEHTRDDDRIRYLAIASFNYTGTFPILLDIRRRPAREEDAGTCELGSIITHVMSRELEWYEYGADLVALRGAGVRLSWEAAQWLYAVGRAELDELHGEGLTLGERPRHIRLRLFHTPFTPSRKVPGTYLNDGTSDDDLEPPAAFAFVGAHRGSAARHARDHALLASVVCGLTRHPDSQIDQLLHDPDPDATHVLRDLLLQRGQPIEPLLRDRADASGLTEMPLVDVATIDDELGALWEQVIALDPMLE
jgi:hypothetical protein